MKRVLKIFSFFLFALIVYLVGVENISVNVGDENTSIKESEWFESRNPHISIIQSENDEQAGIYEEAFLNFLQQFGNAPLGMHSVVFKDTTGDGELEKVTREVILNKGICEVKNIIEKKGEQIWLDQFSISKRDVELFIGEKYSTDTYLPYAMYFLGKMKSNFIADISQSTTSAKWKGFISDHLPNYMSIDGIYIFEVNEFNRGIFRWSKETNRFEKVLSLHQVTQIS